MGSTTTRRTVVLFTRDLRLNDHPALAAAASADDGSAEVLPLFVFDPAVTDAGFATPNRTAFLLESLADLRHNLRATGSDLVLRHGDPAGVAVDMARSIGASRIVLSADYSRLAMRRESRLRDLAGRHDIVVEAHGGITVVPVGQLITTSRGPYKVFTPFWRAWERARWRPIAATPTELRLPADVEPGELPATDRTGCSPNLAPGGEELARADLALWTKGHLADYESLHDDLAADRTSHTSAHLHFGTLSALELATRLRSRPGGEAFVRQLCWRDFHHETLARFPALPDTDLRPRAGVEWSRSEADFRRWAEGRTGVDIVDAAMHQLLDEGWMHNRTRMVTASYLTKTMGVDWRLGARHFLRWLVDGDIANNSANWQWVAGTGCDTRPNRVLNPHRQAKRFDPDGTYVERYLGGRRQSGERLFDPDS